MCLYQLFFNRSYFEVNTYLLDCMSTVPLLMMSRSSTAHSVVCCVLRCTVSNMPPTWWDKKKKNRWFLTVLTWKMLLLAFLLLVSAFVHDKSWVIPAFNKPNLSGFGLLFPHDCFIIHILNKAMQNFTLQPTMTFLFDLQALAAHSSRSKFHSF